MALRYDPEHGDILDETGRTVASLHAGPDNDRLGRQMAAAPEMEASLRQAIHDMGWAVNRSSGKTVIVLPADWQSSAVAALRRAGGLP